MVVEMFSEMLAASNPDLQESDDPSADFPLPDFVRPFLFAVFVALIITILQLLVMLTNIRRNVLQAFRGDDSELPRRKCTKWQLYHRKFSFCWLFNWLCYSILHNIDIHCVDSI